MKTVVLLSCVATKAPTPQPAEKLYQSALFEKSLNYAKHLKPNAIYILSAKHYLLPLNKVIAPYDKTLNDMGADEVKEWAQRILAMLRKSGYDLQRDKFIFLAGSRYRKYLEPELRNYSVPMDGLRIGQQMAWLNKQMSNIKEIIKQVKQIVYEIFKSI